MTAGSVYVSLLSCLRASIAVVRRLRIGSDSGGVGRAIFDIHMAPLIPGSFSVNRCCLRTGVGLSPLINERRKVIVSSVRRSHFVEVGESQSEWYTADLRKDGSLGRNMRAAARGPS